jgi:hypothetical protein
MFLCAKSVIISIAEILATKPDMTIARNFTNDCPSSNFALARGDGHSDLHVPDDLGAEPEPILASISVAVNLRQS